MRSGPPAKAAEAIKKVEVIVAERSARLANMAQPPRLHPAFVHGFANEVEQHVRLHRTLRFLHELLLGGVEQRWIHGEPAHEPQVLDLVLVEISLLLERSLVQTDRGL